MSLANWTITTSDSNDAFADHQYKILNNSVAASGEGSLSDTGSQVSLTYFVNYVALGQFLDDLMGTTTANTTGLQRNLPEEHPSFNTYYANRTDFKPYGQPFQSGRAPGWPKAAVTCVFAPVPFNVKQDSQVTSELQRFCIKNMQTKVDYLNCGIGSFYFVNGASPKVPIAASPGFLVPSQILEITWLKIPIGQYGIDYSPMDSYVKNNLGKLNTTTFEQWTTAGTVLFMDYKTERVLPSTQTGNQYWNLTYTFGIRDNGWNYFWNNTDQAWELVTTTGLSGGGKVYPSSFDCNQLFMSSNFV